MNTTEQDRSVSNRFILRVSLVARRAWEWWKPIALKIGSFQARLLLAIFYMLIFAPFALIVRVGTDPLAIKPRTPRGWRMRDAPEESTLPRALRQF